MSGIVEAHGGSVGTFIGDAVMAVFGMPVAHEDDALRACRSALDMRDALPEPRRAGAHRDQYGRSRQRNPWKPGDGRRRQRRGAPRAGGTARRDPDRRQDVRAGRRGRGRRSARAARAQGQVEARARLPARRDHGHVRATARHSLRRPRRELRALRQAWRACPRPAAVRAGDRPRRRRRRQVAADDRVPLPRSTLASSAAAACRTERESPIGRWSRC